MMNYSKLEKKELIKIIESIISLLENNNQTEFKSSVMLSKQKQNDLENLIGTIPFLMQNKDIFEKNQDIADFAQKLNINIPSPEKKSREDIVGRIIFAIASFDNTKIFELNSAIKTLKKTDIKKGKKNFFNDWENAIKKIEF